MDKITIIIEKIDGLWYVSAPEVGSIYIEEEKLERALDLSIIAVKSILKARGFFRKESDIHINLNAKELPSTSKGD